VGDLHPGSPARRVGGASRDVEGIQRWHRPVVGDSRHDHREVDALRARNRAEPHRPERGGHRQDDSRHGAGEPAPVGRLPGGRLEHRLLPVRADPGGVRHHDRAGHHDRRPALRRREPLHGPERRRHEAGLRGRLPLLPEQARANRLPNRHQVRTDQRSPRRRLLSGQLAGSGQSLQERAHQRPEQDEHLGQRRSDRPHRVRLLLQRHHGAEDLLERGGVRAAGTRSPRPDPTMRATRRRRGPSRSAPAPTRRSTRATGS
jgi:hypothetical protein